MSTETDGDRAALIPGAHRPIRVLGADEGPIRGTLVATGDAVAVMADADDLGGWAGWTYAGRDHVLGPLDLVRRPDGHDVLLPWCTVTVDAFLGRRAAIGAALTAGEASTLVVSLLRGVGEVLDEDDHGRWWLTDGGRPVFVIGEGEDVRDAAAALVDRVQREGSDRALGRLLAAVHDGLLDGRARPRIPIPQLERWEAELFEIAAPRALDTAMHAPERVRGIEVLRDGGRRMPATRRAARSAALGSARDRGVRERVRTASADAAERVRVAWIALAARRRRPEAGRGGAARKPSSPPGRRKIVIAGAAAVAVIAGGLLWPGGATGEAGPSAPGGAGSEPVQSPSSTSAKPNADDSAAPSTSSERAGAADDPVAAAIALLDDIAECASEHDTTCASSTAVGSAGAVDALAAVLSGDDAPDVGLVDAYGDVAVVRLSPTTAEDAQAQPEAELMIVLVRLDEKWLVRDVYGVADQPG